MNSHKIQGLLDATIELAINEIEKEARDILLIHRELNEFVMGMGTCFFTVKDSKETISLTDVGYMEDLAEFLGDFDEALHLTGHAMRFTAKGPPGYIEHDYKKSCSITGTALCAV